MIDIFKVAGGVAQSIRLLKRVKPDVVFAKGGYVSLPVGYAAHLLNIPLVIHDSDVRPGLTNRVLSRWAAAIATGTPVGNYRYKAEFAQYTGVPVRAEFHPFTAASQRAAKKALGFDASIPLVVVTGGGLGARELNETMPVIGQRLLDAGYNVFHVTGKAPFHTVSKAVPSDDRYKLVPFVYTQLSAVYGAADIIVTRASATTLQELAAVAKPAIVIPNSSLGDQLENAETYADTGAILLLRDEQLIANPDALFEAIDVLGRDATQRTALARAIHTYAKPDAASAVAALIIRARR